MEGSPEACGEEKPCWEVSRGGCVWVTGRATPVPAGLQSDGDTSCQWDDLRDVADTGQLGCHARQLA